MSYLLIKIVSINDRIDEKSDGNAKHFLREENARLLWRTMLDQAHIKSVFRFLKSFSLFYSSVCSTCIEFRLLIYVWLNFGCKHVNISLQDRMFPADIISVKSERVSRSDNMIWEVGEPWNVYILRADRYKFLSYVVQAATDREIFTSV